MCNSKIRQDQLSPVKMIQESNVKLICTTDDPVDDLKYHKLLKEKPNQDFKVLPTFRPDKSFHIHKEEYLDYMKELATTSNLNINSYQELIQALKERIKYFDEAGCLMADHSLETLIYIPASLNEVKEIFLED